MVHNIISLKRKAVGARENRLGKTRKHNRGPIETYFNNIILLFSYIDDDVYML